MRNRCIVAADNMDAIRRNISVIEDEMFSSQASGEFMLERIAVIKADLAQLETAIQNEYMTAIALAEISF